MSCPICDDTGWKAVDVDGVRRVVRCDCWKRELGSKLLASARIPERYANCTLEGFRTPTNSLKDAARRARTFIDAFPGGPKGKGFLFYGPIGAGKTHLAAAILRECATTRGAQGVFYEIVNLMRDLRETYSSGNRSTEMSILRPIMTADLVVLDDLGKEKASDWVEETLGLIISTRYNTKKPTIVTTNLPDNSEAVDSIVARIGQRNRSRLLEMCDWVEMKSVDYRELGDNPSPEEVEHWKRHSPGSPQLGAGLKNLPPKSRGQMKSRIPTGPDPRLELKWPGGKAGT